VRKIDGTSQSRARLTSPEASSKFASVGLATTGVLDQELPGGGGTHARYSSEQARDTLSFVDAPDWSTIPPPADDGATRHLVGLRVSPTPLRSTDGAMVDLSALTGRTIVYAYPRTGKPGVENPPGWDMIPGARGCSPQSCSFRDHFAELKSLGVRNLFGLSTQDSSYQKEAADRLHLPFGILSDEKLAFSQAMSLPLFETSGMTLLKRFTMVIDDGVVTHVFYPVFPPDRNAADVIAWLKAG
jgi:peroxiredoxin